MLSVMARRALSLTDSFHAPILSLTSFGGAGNPREPRNCDIVERLWNEDGRKGEVRERNSKTANWGLVHKLNIFLLDSFE